MFFLQRQIFPQNEARLPLDWQQVYGRRSSITVEIGFGSGEFLVNAAEESPQDDFLGIELSRESVLRLLKKAGAAGLQNVRAIRQDARLILRECFPDNSIDHVVMNFPDPWPKSRHRNRRLLDRDFANILAAVLKPDSHYELVTDQQWYAEQAMAVFDDSPHFETSALEKNPQRPVTTRYQKKWLEMGRDSFRITARKIAHNAITRQLENSEMPHAFIERELSEADIRVLDDQSVTKGDKWVVFKGSFRGLEAESYLVRVVSKDQAFKQDFFVLLKRAKDKRWLAKLDPVSNPYRTPAVKMAIAEIGRRLQLSEGDRSFDG